MTATDLLLKSLRRFRARKLFLLTAVAATALLFCSPICRAEVYRWVDKDGTVHYGSKLPPGVSGTSKLSGRPISRYSSEKLMKGYGTRRPTGVEVKTETVSKLNRANQVKLEQGQLIVKHDEQNRVTECSVTVKNTGGQDAHRVIVSFAFEDGKLVPGQGPEGVTTNGQQIYAVAPEHLPITVDSANKASPPMPSVLIEHG